MRTLQTLALCCALLGCQKADNSNPPAGAASGSATATSTSATKPGAMKPPTMIAPDAGPPKPPPPPAKDIDSKDILARTETTPEVDVKHVLIGWQDLADAYGGHMDPRAAKRTNDEAAALATEIADKLKKDPKQIDALIDQYSEDPSSLSHNPYTINPGSGMVPEFKNLGLRLKENEIGIVKTTFGYHVMERVPPDPLQSNDILARPLDPKNADEVVHVQHVMIGWKGVGRDPRAAARTKEDADKLAKETLAKVKKGDDMAKLMKELSEDPGSKDNAKVYDVDAKGHMPPQFKNLALRLKMGEAGLVKSQAGWHVMKRVPAPPPDSLESADILARKPETDKAKVKHILLGWKDVHAEDERGKKRERADLEKLVKETVAKLKKGDPIEPLMKELSEDPGSAEKGTDYPVSPDAQLVEPFKKLSLRLKVGEVGVVKTDFGIHIIKRTE